jgi:tripartite-type tricarboxylate transporter receptor subunit TctC
MLKALLASLVLFLAAASALAEDWPAKPITVLMGFPAGSGVDVVARMLQPSLEKSLGQRLVLDYKTGAGGNVASEIVANARPDGYTFLLGTAATHGVNPALYPRLSFDVEADFTPISTLVDVSNVLAINPEVIDAKLVLDFIAKVKAAPGRYNYASTGNGTGTHLAFAEFNARAGLDMVHVPYRGGPDAIQAVLKGDVCCIFNQVQTILQHYRAGKVRLLGVTPRNAWRRSRRCRRSMRQVCRATRATPGSPSSGPKGSIRRSPGSSTPRSSWRSTIRKRRRSSPSSATRHVTGRSSSSRPQ